MFRAIIISLFFLSIVPCLRGAGLDQITQSCGYQKAHDLIDKVLLVYAMHALTIKMRAGASIPEQILESIWSLFCPGYACMRAFIDLNMAFCAWDGDRGCVNTESACVRIEKERVKDGMRLINKNTGVNSEELKSNEVFIVIPRGAYGSVEHIRKLDSNSKQLKAVVGIVNLVLGVMQVVTATGGSVAKYGTGSYAFTIVPYLIASSINGLAAIFTPTYSEMQEFRLKEPDQEKCLTQRTSRIISLLSLTTQHYNIREYLFSAVYFLLNIVVYVGIVGGMTHFEQKESTVAQRGWFISWAILGSAYGCAGYLVKLSEETIKNTHSDKEKAERQISSITSSSSRMITSMATILSFGAPAIGGLVALCQQYLADYTCQ
jgi:uncharacterized membrane protein HdeD (DUF308 family)